MRPSHVTFLIALLLSLSVAEWAAAAEDVSGPVVKISDVSISGQVGAANANGTDLPEQKPENLASIVKEAASSVAKEVDKTLIKVRRLGCMLRLHGGMRL